MTALDPRQYYLIHGSYTPNTSLIYGYQLNDGTFNTTFGAKYPTPPTDPGQNSSAKVSGSGCSGFGHLTLKNNTGVSNSAFGWSALTANNTGDSNTAVGHTSMKVNTSGSYNTAVGQQTMSANSTGSQNVAIGYNALPRVDNGTGHTAVGSNSGSSLGSGYSNNTIIGYNADCIGNFNTVIGSTASAKNCSNSTAIGYGAKPSQSNQVILGTSSEVVCIPGQLKIPYNNSGSPTVIGGIPTPGLMYCDDSYIYIYASTGWKRCALVSFT